MQVAFDLIDYSNSEWLTQWLLTQEFKVLTWNVLCELDD